MKVEKREGSMERRILIGMVLDRATLAAIASRWEKPGLFKSKWANVLGGWCVRHFTKYNNAPKQAIESIYERWEAQTSDKQSAEMMAGFLDHLSNEASSGSEINSAYLIDAAGEYFNAVRLESMAQSVLESIEDGRIEDAQTVYLKHKQVDLGVGTGVDVLFDQEAVDQVFSEAVEPLIKYNGALGEFFGSALARDCFVSFMGPEKRGKSWWLMDVAYRGMLSRKKVAWLQAGDQSQKQVMARFLSRVARAPMRSKTVKIPKQIERRPSEKSASVKFEERVFEHGLTKASAWAALQELTQGKTAKLRTNESLLKLSCHPAGSLSVPAISSLLDTWEQQQGWIADIVVIDYADILALPAGMDRREGTNEVWQSLRRLSQQRHCLVVTATQTDAASYDSYLITRRNFTEDKRKLAHVSAMIGLNQTLEEQELQVTRLNFIALRDDEYNVSRAVHAAGCLGIANPALRSCW